MSQFGVRDTNHSPLRKLFVDAVGRFFAVIARMGKVRMEERGGGLSGCHTRQGRGFRGDQFALRGDGGSGFRFHRRTGGDLRLGPWPTEGRAFATASFGNDGLDELDFQRPEGSQMPNSSGMRLASLEMPVPSLRDR